MFSSNMAKSPFYLQQSQSRKIQALMWPQTTTQGSTRKSIMGRFIPFWTSGRSKRAWGPEEHPTELLKATLRRKIIPFQPYGLYPKEYSCHYWNFMICFGVFCLFVAKNIRGKSIYVVFSLLFYISDEEMTVAITCHEIYTVAKISRHSTC